MTSTSIPVLTPPADLTHKTLGPFEADVEPHRAAAGPGLVLDLSSVAFINSTGLGFLVHLGKQMAESDRRLALAGANRKVERLIRLVGLGEMLPLFKTVPDASRYVAQAR